MTVTKIDGGTKYFFIFKETKARPHIIKIVCGVLPVRPSTIEEYFPYQPHICKQVDGQALKKNLKGIKYFLSQY